MRLALGIVLLALAVYAVARFQSEETWCYAMFPMSEQAEQASGVLWAAGFRADLEEAGPDARRATSRGARNIGATFKHGETGKDAESAVVVFNEVIQAVGGTLAHPDPGCLERSPFTD